MQLDGVDIKAHNLKQSGEQAPESKRTKQLVDLDTDAFNCILEQLDHRKSWLRSLLLVSKHLYDLVLPRMYRKLDITIHDSFNRREFQYSTLYMLDQDNQGLKHIRYLVMRDSDADSSSTDLRDFPDAAMLVQLLPKDTLLRVEYVLTS
ncbi:MAG: hypothetical protein Q9199_006970 [Rusavskia elegans]